MIWLLGTSCFQKRLSALFVYILLAERGFATRLLGLLLQFHGLHCRYNIKVDGPVPGRLGELDGRRDCVWIEGLTFRCRPLLGLVDHDESRKWTYLSR